MLQIQNISKRFGDKAVLTDVTLTVPDGATHALIGSSGSGKTTLLRITLGLISFDEGYVRINGQPLLSFVPSDWAAQIGYVPQDGGLFPHLNARQNVTLIANVRGWAKSLINSRLEELSHLVDLDVASLNRFPFELSGGQKQRVAIMRAAFFNPSVMILDEPMGSLDPLVRRSLQDELKQIFRRLNKTVFDRDSRLSRSRIFC